MTVTIGKYKLIQILSDYIDKQTYRIKLLQHRKASGTINRYPLWFSYARFIYGFTGALTVFFGLP
jgi:hypothetical protein